MMEMINCSKIWHYFIIFTSSCLVFKRDVLLIEHTVKFLIIFQVNHYFQTSESAG